MPEASLNTTAPTRFLGVDLAWGEGKGDRVPNETGYAVLDEAGQILEAGWTRGVEETADWLLSAATPGSVTAIDAPLVVTNPSGMRECEREVGRAYGRWQVSANASNTAMGWQAGVALRSVLEEAGFIYVDDAAPGWREHACSSSATRTPPWSGCRNSVTTSSAPATNG
jgi:hypothetical protein